MNSQILKPRATAFDYLFDSVVVTDSQGIITDWNKGSEALYGYSKEDAIGQSVSMLHVPEDTDHITSEVISAVGELGKWTGEIRMLHKNGDIGWIESMCVPIYDSNEKMVGALGVNRNITGRIKEAERLQYLAHYDYLTKIPNRYLLFDRVEHLIAQSKRHKMSFALLYIDLDKFKTINDTKGHTFGDQVLIETAIRLKQCIRGSDTVARIGGDEFVILLEEMANKNDVSLVVETLDKAFNKAFIVDGNNIEVCCSVGVAIYPDQGTTMDSLLAIADKDMYKTKLRDRD
ncbi:sensor domain-containing diguanylate cyclase [Shewanella gelidimarina]|uniref:sensor domain-containing diguanylate cyclase n=1 Tax=Shewanella gelidimarina TaxID=56813 RepID=UPI00200F7D31|nr:sensor domain-containing diguanylate cyclase [Shewanella gelidimarina]MCL1058997.1 sensor domain-containing diguanylate cyclase [Shewanella gelidimarina]